MTSDEAVKKINKYMKKNNCKQWQLAELLGASPATLNRWIARKNKISRVYIRILEMEKII